VVPQLGHNAEALRKRLVKDAVVLPSGTVAFYKVEIDRFDNFFTALSCGIVYKACGASLPAEYRIGHLYHGFKNEKEMPEEKALNPAVFAFYSGEPIAGVRTPHRLVIVECRDYTGGATAWAQT
jgi:hypothetical protein